FDGDRGVWRGDLILKGYGDPTLSAADLRSLALEVRAVGVRQVTGRVLGDESWFDSRRTAPGWRPALPDPEGLRRPDPLRRRPALARARGARRRRPAGDGARARRRELVRLAPHRARVEAGLLPRRVAAALGARRRPGAGRQL